VRGQGLGIQATHPGDEAELRAGDPRLDGV
jgi:hypothetical protein